MGTTLSEGIFKPAVGDKGSVFGPGLSANAQIQNDHQHTGSDGSKAIATKSLSKGSASLASGDWVASGEKYYQTVTLPSGYTYDTTMVLAKIGNGTADGDYFQPTIEKASATQFNIYVNDNTIDVDLLYI
jgi:hypothetical protein